MRSGRITSTFLRLARYVSYAEVFLPPSPDASRMFAPCPPVAESHVRGGCSNLAIMADLEMYRRRMVLSEQNRTSSNSVPPLYARYFSSRLLIASMSSVLSLQPLYHSVVFYGLRPWFLSVPVRRVFDVV